MQSTESTGPAYVRNPDIPCDRNCQPIKCPNFMVCGDIAPMWYFQCCHGTCRNCDMMFGKKLDLKEDPEECPVCIEIAPAVVQPNCQHSVCINCFKRCWYGAARNDEPRFPYPDREDEYFDYEPSYEVHPLYTDPLVVKYHADWNRWDDDWNAKRATEGHLRKCPLCRK